MSVQGGRELEHREVPVAAGGFKADVDEGIAPDVLLLWQHGLETVFSCQAMLHFGRAGQWWRDLGRMIGIRFASDLDQAASLLPWVTYGTRNPTDFISLTEHFPVEAQYWQLVWEKGAHVVTGHVHNPYYCPAHEPRCGCPDLNGSLCNPYRQAGRCPDDLRVMPDDPRYQEATA